MGNQILLFALLSLMACNSNQDQAHADNPAQTDAVATDFKKLDTTLNFAGFWVNESYIESIKKVKSPTKADIPELSCFFLFRKEHCK